MDKPISIAISELERGIGSAINESHLHPSIVKNILMNFYTVAAEQARELEIREAIAWEESQNTEDSTEEAE